MKMEKVSCQHNNIFVLTARLCKCMVDFEGFSTDLSCLSTICLLIHLCLSTAQIINLNSRDETRLLPNTVLDVLCWAEDNCLPEIREQGDCCPEAEEGDISLCPSDWDSLSLLFGAKRLQDKCKAQCCIFFQPHPVDLSHAYFIKHTEDAESLIGGKSWLVSAVGDVQCGRGQRSEHQQKLRSICCSAHFSQKMDVNAEKFVSEVCEGLLSCTLRTNWSQK